MSDQTVSLRTAEKAVHSAFGVADDMVRTMRKLLAAKHGEIPSILERQLGELEERVRANRANTISRLRRGELE